MNTDTDTGNGVVASGDETKAKKKARKPAAKKVAKAAKPAKKTKAAKANGNGAKKKASGNAGKGRRAKFSDNAKIKLIVKENPRRKGSTSYDKYAKFRDGMTVGEFIKAGERHENWNMRGTIDSAIKRGQISVTEKA